MEVAPPPKNYVFLILILPANISTYKDNATPHDDKEWLESYVVLEALDNHDLAWSIVTKPSTLPHQVGVVSS